MFRTRWHPLIAFAVLVNYAAILTIGPSLHDHGHRAVDQSAGGCASTTCCFQANDETAGNPDTAERRAGNSDSSGEQITDGSLRSSECSICRFLTQKPAPTHLLRMVASSPFVDRSRIAPPAIVCQPLASSGDIRAPPTTS